MAIRVNQISDLFLLLVLMMKKQVSIGRTVCRSLLVCLLFICFGCDRQPNSSSATTELDSKSVRLSEVQEIVSSEELILALTNRLGPLNRAAKNLQIPSGAADSLFSGSVRITDIGPGQSKRRLNEYLELVTWQIDPQTNGLDQGIWRELVSQVSYFETAKFYLIDGELDAVGKRFRTNMGFAGHARMNDERYCHVTAKISVTWSISRVQVEQAKIVQWQTTSLQNTLSSSPMFSDVTRDCIADPSIADELATSMHEQITRKLIQGQPVARRPDDKYRLFFPEVTLEHPAVSIVDVDADGLDDFFLCRQHLPSLFFRNQGDGTFTEVGEQIGLRIDNDCTCSLFADFDNDGDQDVFIGRGRHRALYRENENGMFVDQSLKRIACDLPFMVSSVCAADFDNNGLLDVYFSTYSPIEGSHGIADKGKNIWPSHFLSTIEFVEYRERRATAHPYIDMAGPPNLLLENRGGEFKVAKCNADVESWRKSFQASWCDFDQDGDADLYVCNDFARDDLYRNESGQFVRVSDELGLNFLGFGMGVSWNDHNNDGTFDLYVSNMYSKAGTRITRQVAGIDPGIQQMATGNYLFEMHDGVFQLVSLEGPQKAVSRTGWSWGGQLTDFDNDGFHDIFVANGYYSAPQELAEPVDL